MLLNTFDLLQIYLYDCTEVSPYCLLFFGGDISIQKDKDQDTIAVDEWIVFESPARIGNLVKVIVHLPLFYAAFHSNIKNNNLLRRKGPLKT